MKPQWSFSTCGFLTLGCLFAVLIAIPLYAQQQSSGAINGTVKDSSGAVLPGATITAIVQATGVPAVTQSDSAGQYTLPNLPVGFVNLKVSSEGFKSTEFQNLRMVAGQTLTIDATLSVGSVTESISVNAEAERVDTTSSDMGTTLSTEELTSLPLAMGGNPRAALSFLTTLSSINTKPGSGGISAGGNQAANFANSSIQGSSPFGGNQNNVSYTIDGVNAAYRLFTTVADFSSLPPEDIQEFRLASNFNAEQGWDNGVGIAYVTKSGTNSFHGTAWWYGQNTALDAASKLSKSVSPDHQNEWGGMVGGPIRRDKTFFFFTLDFFRFSHIATGQVATVPTPQMVKGDFSQVLGAQIGTDALGRPVFAHEIYDPTTTRTLPGGAVVRDPYMCNAVLNTICPGQVSSVSQYFANGYPAPTQAGIQNNWVGNQVPSPLSIDKFSFKIDQAFGAKYHLMGMLDAAPYYSQGSGTVNFGPILTVSQVGPAYQYRPRAALTGTLRSNLLFNVNFSASYVGSRLETTGASTTAGQAAGLTGVYTPNLPMVAITTTTGFGLKYLSYSNPQYVLPAIGGFVGWVKGSHSLKFGADYIRSSIADYNLLGFTAGQYNFSNLSTSLPGFAQTGWGFASFLTGNVASATLNTPENLHHVGKGFSLYAQDQWRATPKLTINAGLRWSAAIGPHEVQGPNAYGAFDPSIPNPAAGNLLGALSFWGNGPGHNGHIDLIAPNYNLWEPRLGLAYSITPTFVVRAYYGVINTPTFASFNQGTLASNYGQFAQTTVSSTDNGVTPFFNWQTIGYPPQFKPVVPNFDPSLLNGSAVEQILYHQNQAGRTQSFGISLQRALPWGMTGTAEYIGKLTHGLPLQNAIFFAPFNLGGFPGNQLDTKFLSLGNLLLADIHSQAAMAAGIPVPYPGFNGTVAQALLPYPQYTYIAEGSNTRGFSLYNAGHFSVQKRFGNGLSFLVDNTVSKQLASGFFQADQYNTRKHLSGIDIPWVLTLSYAYDLPFGPGKTYLNRGGVIGQLVGGWNVSGIYIYQGGTVLSVTTEASVPGITYIEPLRVAGQPFGTGVSCSNYVRGQSPYLNIHAFATPPPFTLGNIVVLPNFRGCGYATENISVNKIFAIKESMHLKFSANFFNAFNRHYWTGLGTDINNTSAFGQFTGVTAPRTIQLSGKFEF
jgi:hypothetical protein